MAFIYKITNNKNGKCYIGKTERTVEIRWKEHLRHLDLYETIPLYRAIKKYGIENFSIETIEECDSININEREQYWIRFFNSYGKTGYNATLGGEGSLLKISEDEVQEIIFRYQKGERLDCLCKEFHHDYETIKKIFNEQGVLVDVYAGPKKLSKKIYGINPKTLEIELEFESISAAGRALCAEGRNPRAIANHISKYKDTGTVSHGYLWRTENNIKKELE